MATLTVGRTNLLGPPRAVEAYPRALGSWGFRDEGVAVAAHHRRHSGAGVPSAMPSWPPHPLASHGRIPPLLPGQLAPPEHLAPSPPSTTVRDRCRWHRRTSPRCGDSRVQYLVILSPRPSGPLIELNPLGHKPATFPACLNPCSVGTPGDCSPGEAHCTPPPLPPVSDPEPPARKTHAPSVPGTPTVRTACEAGIMRGRWALVNPRPWAHGARCRPRTRDHGV